MSGSYFEFHTPIKLIKIIRKTSQTLPFHPTIQSSSGKISLFHNTVPTNQQRIECPSLAIIFREKTSTLPRQSTPSADPHYPKWETGHYLPHRKLERVPHRSLPRPVPLLALKRNIRAWSKG